MSKLGVLIKHPCHLIKDVTFSLGRVGVKGNSDNVTQYDGFFDGIPN